MNGYGGSILRVNLSTGKIAKEPTPPELARDFIGGRGFGAYLLFKEVPQGADPLGPENKLIISSGPLSGLLIPGAGKCDFACKSPLTGGYASASLGGLFTAEVKYAGLDSIILEGASPKPVYLFIDDDKIELCDASSLWGKGAITVEKELKEKLGEEFQIVCVGPGAENGVLYAHINHDYGRQAGRGGVGTVMGAKKIKAIAIRGTKSIPVADMAAYRQAGMKLYDACKRSELLKPWQHWGTTMVVSWCDEIGALPTRNFAAGSFGRQDALRSRDTRANRHHRQGMLWLSVAVWQVQPDETVRHAGRRSRVRNHWHGRIEFGNFRCRRCRAGKLFVRRVGH